MSVLRSEYGLGVKSRLRDLGVNSVKGPLRRLIRWYLAPSGLLLVAATALLLLAFTGWGPTWAWGGAGVGLLTVFLTYRFSRQQGLFFQALRNQQQTTTEQLGGLRNISTDLVRTVESHAALLETHLAGLSPRIGSLEADSQALRDGLAQTQSLLTGLDYRMRALGDDQKSANTTFESLASRIEALEVAARDDAKAEPEVTVADVDDGPTADVVRSLRSDLALWAASADRQSFNGVALIVSPERSGTTWVFDILRSLPGASQVATSFVYRTLGIVGNRYPKGLVEGDSTGEPIELRDGVGAFLPKLRQQTFGRVDDDCLAVEKVHPSAFDFEPTALLSPFAGLERALGRGQIVLLIRDPVDTYRSFRSYQESADWRRDVAPDSVARFFASSLSAMDRLRRLHDGCLVVSYEDLVANPAGVYTSLANRIGLKADAAAVSHVLEAAERRKSQAADNSYFSRSRIRRAAQLIVGDGLPSDQEREALEQARERYEQLWLDRVS